MHSGGYFFLTERKSCDVTICGLFLSSLKMDNIDCQLKTCWVLGFSWARFPPSNFCLAIYDLYEVGKAC